jgi:ubiquinone/menaquinone biosynthesis C-methylase UbiE
MSNRKAFFNQAAATWDKQFGTPKLIQSLTQIVPKFPLKAGQKILDLGTGTGVLIPYLLRLVGPDGHITAVDFAEEMVELCRAKNVNDQNVTVLVGDAENLQFPAQTFDDVSCFGLFPHIENKEKALQQINRVLKNGGKLIIAHALSSKEIRLHHKNAPAVVAHDELPVASEMYKMLKKAGFARISIIDELGCYLCISTKVNSLSYFI